MTMTATLICATLASVPLEPGTGGAPGSGNEGSWVAQESPRERILERLKRGPPGQRRRLQRQNLERLRRRSAERRRQRRQEREKQQRSDSRRTQPRSSAGDDTSTRNVAQASPDDTKINYTQRQRQGKFSFDFSKAEIVDIVKAISDMTRRNFIIPEKLKSERLTILSPTPVTAAEAYQVFLTALEVNGITIVRKGKFYKLVESDDAVKQPIPTCVGPDDECPEYSDRMITMVLHPENIDATEVDNIIKALISRDGEITVFQPTNTLIVSEYAPNLARVRRIIESLDVGGFQDELQIVRVKYATAAEIADKLTQVFDVQGRGKSSRRGRRRKKGSEEEQAQVQISKIVADERTNQIVIKANPKSFEAIRGLIAKLDIPISQAEEGRVHVYYLENAKAEELASTLSNLTENASPAGNRRNRNKNKQGASAATLFEGEMQISADKATNSLIVVSSGRDFRALKRIIEQLDVPRKQVYVEAAFLEVTVTGDSEYGTDWHTPVRFSEDDLGFLGEDISGRADETFGFIKSAQSGNTIDPQGLLNAVGGAIVGLVGAPINLPFAGGELNIPSFAVLLRALQSSSNARVLSTPHILTTDNEEASIEVGQRIPFRRGTSIPAGGGFPGVGGAAGGAAGAQNLQALSGFGSLFSATDRIDVSLKLSLTPHINERNQISLELEQQIEDVVGRDEQTQQPITANRSAKTTIMVRDQQTVVIGGLMRDRERESESKIPILGDLPLLGWLFKTRSTETEKVNLILVLTPYIIRSQTDFQRIFERKMQQYERFAAEYYGNLPEYRAHIDYSRKNGPLAQMVRTVKTEKEKLENGGRGDGSDVLIQPAEPSGAKSDSNGEAKTPEPVFQGDGGSEKTNADTAPQAGDAASPRSTDESNAEE